jgi:hypothetical protein
MELDLWHMGFDLWHLEVLWHMGLIFVAHGIEIVVHGKFVV